MAETAGHHERGRYRVPDGLRPLLEALARETLRLQPRDLVDFAQFFITELQHHRASNPNSDILCEPLSYEMFRTDLQRKFEADGEKQQGGRPGSPLDQAATKIQAAFRGHIARVNLKQDMTRTHSSDMLSLADNKKDQKRHSIGCDTVSNNPEDRAATRIQAEIRGFLARKQVEKMKKEDAAAATKIQAHIRGYLTRKHLEEQGVISSTRSRSIHSSRSDDLDRTA